MSAKKNKKTGTTLKKASVEVGKALARSTHKVEETGRKAKKAAEKLVKEASHKAETTMEETLKKVKTAVKRPQSSAKKTKASAAALLPGKGMDVTAHMGFLAGEIFQYLDQKGTTPVEKIVKALKNSSNSEALIYSSIGWLARECKISFSPDGALISLLP